MDAVHWHDASVSSHRDLNRIMLHARPSRSSRKVTPRQKRALEWADPLALYLAKDAQNRHRRQSRHDIYLMRSIGYFAGLCLQSELWSYVYINYLPIAPRHPSVLVEKGAFSFPKVQDKWRPTKS